MAREESSVGRAIGFFIFWWVCLHLHFHFSLQNLKMPINGEVSEGDANRILEVVGEDYFDPNFNEYMLKEQLKWWRHTRVYIQRSYFGWVFWREQDRQIEPSLPRDNRANFNPDVCAIPKVESNIRHALEKVISHLSFNVVNSSLIQFWAPATLEGRTQLRTQYQPFALGPTMDTTDRERLCEYRVKMCSSEYNNCFYVDAESGEEQLGLPGRVFRYQFPESIPRVWNSSTKEYPQRDLALRCNITASLAVPVFEHSSRTCVGVLEIVSPRWLVDIDWPKRNPFHYVQGILKDVGLQCFDGYKICKMRSSENVKTNNSVFQELETVIRLVCETHRLPLAMAWVSCSACSGLRPMGVNCARIDDNNLATFLRVSECSHLRKGWVAGRALSSYMLYFPSITRLSVDEYPLVPYARMCKFSGWFIICLQNSNTRDDKYVLEFFWSTGSEDSEDIGVIQARLNKILGMMAEKLGNFRFSSGENVGDLSYVEVFNAQNDPKKGSFYEIQATKTFSSRDSEPSSVSSSASVSNLRPW